MLHQQLRYAGEIIKDKRNKPDNVWIAAFDQDT
jgi:hypothetical protein